MANYILATILGHELLPLLLRVALLSGTAPFPLGHLHLYAEAALALRRIEQYQVGYSVHLSFILAYYGCSRLAQVAVGNAEQQVADCGERLSEPLHADVLYLRFSVAALKFLYLARFHNLSLNRLIAISTTDSLISVVVPVTALAMSFFVWITLYIYSSIVLFPRK